MKAVLCVAVQLMLCIGTMAFVDLVGCERGLVHSHKAKEMHDLRQHVEDYFHFRLDDADIIAGFLVHDKDFDEIDHIFFAGRQEDEDAITFKYGTLEDGERTPLYPIPYSEYYLYLTRCKLQVDE